MENNKKHQMTLPNGRIRFSSLDVNDKKEPKYQTRNPYELANAIITTVQRLLFCTPKFPHNLQMIVYKQFTVPKIQQCSNHTPLNIASQQMLR